MTWLSIAEGLRYRLLMAARRDLELTALLEEVTRREKEKSIRSRRSGAEQLDKHIAGLPLNELAGLDFPAGPLATRLIEEMRSHNWIRQNQACRALSNLGPSWCSRLPEPVQEQLGRNVLQSAEGDARAAGGGGPQRLSGGHHPLSGRFAATERGRLRGDPL
jgi:hypothetical protein